MPASRTTMLLMTALLAVTTPLMAQTRNGGAPRRTPRPTPTTDAATAPAPDPTPAPAPTEPIPANGAGVVIPPGGGYYVNPAPIPPGSVGAWGIQNDPLDRAYWEMYDREKPVTLSGKVTRVDWTMPNSYIFLVADGATWVVESAYIQFLQSTVTPAVRAGDLITVTGYYPREQ